MSVENKKAVAYIRDLEGRSSLLVVSDAKVQREAIMECAENKGLEITNIYLDLPSDQNQTQFLRMKEDLKLESNQVKYVLYFDFEIISETEEGMLDFDREMKELGIQEWCCTMARSMRIIMENKYEY